ncbi:hypothetical protein GGR34_000775 [Microvirga flocculans]|uniref:Uncharacterized protein n=1 Tax=Microvirga flocculans TaxID=217168 RepID=A0A7W6ICX6_9HYPH|nr:hypothetical protein [Microvirga flocculans]MBB4039140.1 hypothetical protein [Microvirga flocculans]
MWFFYRFTDDGGWTLSLLRGRILLSRFRGEKYLKHTKGKPYRLQAFGRFYDFG